MFRRFFDPGSGALECLQVVQVSERQRNRRSHRSRKGSPQHPPLRRHRQQHEHICAHDRRNQQRPSHECIGAIPRRRTRHRCACPEAVYAVRRHQTEDEGNADDNEQHAGCDQPSSGVHVLVVARSVTAGGFMAALQSSSEGPPSGSNSEDTPRDEESRHYLGKRNVVHCVLRAIAGSGRITAFAAPDIE
jgi:hypothetical protein